MVTEVHAARLTKFLLWKSIVGLSLAAMIFLSDVVAEHMFTFFSQVNSDSKPVKIEGKEVSFQPIRFGIEFPNIIFLTYQHCG